jgi:hypothetical protein
VWVGFRTKRQPVEAWSRRGSKEASRSPSSGVPVVTFKRVHEEAFTMVFPERAEVGFDASRSGFAQRVVGGREVTATGTIGSSGSGQLFFDLSDVTVSVVFMSVDQQLLDQVVSTIQPATREEYEAFAR